MASIYLIRNKVNGKAYIGKTVNTIEERFTGHCYASRYYNSYLYKAMRKYGLDNFTVELIEETDYPDEREKHWIRTYETLVPHGYNMTEGGTGGNTSDNSPKFKAWQQKIKAEGTRRGANNSMYGTKGGHFGKKHSDEAKRKQSEARRLYWAKKKGITL